MDDTLEIPKWVLDLLDRGTLWHREGVNVLFSHLQHAGVAPETAIRHIVEWFSELIFTESTTYRVTEEAPYIWQQLSQLSWQNDLSLSAILRDTRRADPHRGV